MQIETLFPVEVTADDIANGQPLIGCSCPIALAVKRVAEEGADITVGLNGIHITTRRYSVAFRTPSLVRWFIKDFDGGYPVAPFTFFLYSRDIFDPN